MQSMISQIENNEGSVVFNTKVSRIKKIGNYFEVTINGTEKSKLKILLMLQVLAQ